MVAYPIGRHTMRELNFFIRALRFSTNYPLTVNQGCACQRSKKKWLKICTNPATAHGRWQGAGESLRKYTGPAQKTRSTTKILIK